MSDDFAERVSGIGALAEPARRALYEYVVAQPDAVGREQAARATAIALHSAKFHLEKLVEEGLLEVEYRRLSGRTGPGAGRPAKLYRRAAREVAVSLPERRYDLAGHVLAEAIEEASSGGGDLVGAVRDAARRAGRRTGEQAQSGGASELDRLAGALEPCGYEPRRRDDELVLANCPFDALARDHTALVCGLNEAFIDGVATGLGCSGVEACLDPEPGLCCVKARQR